MPHTAIEAEASNKVDKSRFLFIIILFLFFGIINTINTLGN